MMPVYVCVPVYNGGKTLRATLENILKQEYQDFTLLVYDDGSKDRSLEIATAIANNDSRVKITSGEENRGRGFARNKLLELASDGMVAWQDADDRWHPTKLTSQLAAYQDIVGEKRNDKFILISTYARATKKKGGADVVVKKVPPENFDLAFILGDNYGSCPFQLQAVIGPASTFIESGGFDESLPWAEDIDMALKVLQHGYAIYGHPSEKPLARYMHSLTKVRGRAVEDAHTVLRDRFRDFAAQQGLNFDRVFRRRAAHYIGEIYKHNHNYSRALQMNLLALMDADVTESEFIHMTARRMLAIIDEYIKDKSAGFDDGSGARSPTDDSGLE